MSQPKGSMCASCKHADRNCSHLEFSNMRPAKKYSDGVVAVICTEFERKREAKNGS